MRLYSSEFLVFKLNCSYLNSIKWSHLNCHSMWQHWSNISVLICVTLIYHLIIEVLLSSYGSSLSFFSSLSLSTNLVALNLEVKRDLTSGLPSPQAKFFLLHRGQDKGQTSSFFLPTDSLDL